MAQPLAAPFDETNPNRRWLNPYLSLQSVSDARVVAALKDALRHAENVTRQIEGKAGPGAVVRTAQLQANVIELRKILHELFLVVGGIVKEDSEKAALLAENLLIKDEMQIWKVVVPDKKDRESNLDALRISAQRNIQSTVKRILETERPLSKRVWNSESIAQGQLNKTINRHIAMGSSAAEMAKDLRGFVNPAVSGGAPYRAKTLARTEINNAFHAQSIHDMQTRPWINQAVWNLSKSHSEIGCKCDRYAETRLFPVDNIPLKPHPGCLCTVTPDIPDLDTVMNNYLSGQYGPYLPRVVS